MSSICCPAMFYLIFSIMAIVLMIITKYKNETIIIKTLFVVIWTWFLNFLCDNGLSGVSWFLVLLPFIMFLIMFLMMHEIIESRLHDNRKYLMTNMN